RTSVNGAGSQQRQLSVPKRSASTLRSRTGHPCRRSRHCVAERTKRTAGTGRCRRVRHDQGRRGHHLEAPAAMSTTEALPRLTMVLFVFLVVSCSVGAQAPKQRNTAGVEPLLADARAAIAAGRLADAESTPTRALEIAPESREVQLQLGTVYLLTQRYAQARLFFRQATEPGPDDSPSLV